MSIVTIPRTILRFQYQFVRLPLQLVEDRVVSRLDADAPARLVYERSLGVLDATVGNALGDPRLKRRGAALAKRSDELARAARLEAAAAEELRQADADLTASRENVVDEVQTARAERSTPSTTPRPRRSGASKPPPRLRRSAPGTRRRRPTTSPNASRSKPRRLSAPTNNGSTPPRSG